MSTLFRRFATLLGLCLCAAGACWAQLPKPIPKIAVTTYHYDTFRTGWNSHEGILNPEFCRPFPPGCVVKENFGLKAQVSLDDTVYAQPLIVPDVTIIGGSAPGKHDVVYVATENNSVYAIDANNGQVLVVRNLGQAVPVPPPLDICRNNGPRIGIESTPVIDVASRTLYVMSYASERGHPVYRLHALDIASLNTKRSVLVTASHKADNGSTITFDPSRHRQRAALLLADGNVYAGFASWCDLTPDSRGWLLGWRASNLQPLAANSVSNILPNSGGLKLSSIWMSGYGPAAVAGHLYFVTGNSQKGTYDSHNNLSESVVKVSSDLTRVLDFFTPSDVTTDLDSGDVDFGSGGVLVLPDQPGPVHQMAVAAGKDGRMFLLNRNSLGGFNPAGDSVLDTKQIGDCWCGPSYYLNNVVSSGGTQIGVWQVNTSSAPSLTQIHQSADIGGSGDGGFFTAVSSNGSANVMIWAVSRKSSEASGPSPTLFAFQPVPGTFDLKLVFQSVAGNWNVPWQTGQWGANSNIVPVVANGQVYVASYRELDIFGFLPPVNENEPSVAVIGVSGIITAVAGSRITVRNETGAETQVEAEAAIKNGLSPELAVGQTVKVAGRPDASGLVHADVIKPVRAGRKP